MSSEKQLTIRPISLCDANAFTVALHRHHGAKQGHKFSIACYEGERIVGVVIAGRPDARLADDGKTIEVTRLCTDGTKNACSKLYAAGGAGGTCDGVQQNQDGDPGN